MPPPRFTRRGKHHGPRVTRAANAVSVIEERIAALSISDAWEEQHGFPRILANDASATTTASGEGKRLGWLLNMHETLVKDEHDKVVRSATDYYFLQDDGSSFKCTRTFEPYFFIVCKEGKERVVEDYLRKQFERAVISTFVEEREDLSLSNHLTGRKRKLVRVSFRTQHDLTHVKRALMPIVKENAAKAEAQEAYEHLGTHLSSRHGFYGIDESTQNGQHYGQAKIAVEENGANYIIRMHEHDIDLCLRMSIDLEIRVGLWYDVTIEQGGQAKLELRKDRVTRAEPVVLAYDIETTKLPLKFPDASIDQVMMISYMIDTQGYLITNRDIVSTDINNFEYTPKPEFEGNFIIYNEVDEKATLTRFFRHIREAKPTVFVTYNGDFFDWPFVEARAAFHGMDMRNEIGFHKDGRDDFYSSRHAIHMDCFHWVKRDSYLPVGSHGLKAVTRAKLGYDPAEIDPEDMTRFASEQPQVLAQYSVSDAVATYYLYKKYVQPFIFSLCNIIPLNPDDVLRKGSGTLCEMLLMVEAFRANVLMPNKHEEALGATFDGHLLESETYVGGHVEALRAGVFRSDLPVRFDINQAGVRQLINDAERALRFAVEVEQKCAIEDVENFDDVLSGIKAKLQNLHDHPTRTENPLIYHLDVAAMYPNIILTNRLQPDAMIDEGTCAACDFNVPGKNCDRRMTWSWRGQFFAAKRNEVNMIRKQLWNETFPGKFPNDSTRSFNELPLKEQEDLVKKRVGEYSRKVYGKVHELRVVDKEAIICQREHPFYIDTVRSFRDRRYEYKALHKKWKQNLEKALTSGDLASIDEARAREILYDSLQVAHKCILNSFYGYVMRKGARWYSMEMAGVVCLTGASIIQMARQTVEYAGKPLELDTDGIWCMLPSSFPENYTLKLKNGKSIKLSYPCVMLNHSVHDRFSNHQYQVLKDSENLEYETRSENSIGFEVDGPYRAMILPSSTEEDKLLKKRYAVFNADGSIAELKGFELKRRGELKIVKMFQDQLFHRFLDGSTLQECYASAAKLADQWLDILFSRAATLDDRELIELISENRSMSKSLADYGEQRSTSISTAKRLAEFLGDGMVKDKGLACKFIISARPADLPVSDRAIPVAIFSAEPAVKKYWLRHWLKDSSLDDFDIRSILDWDYYLERVGSVIQKIITIPAAMQAVSNPVPRIPHPDWLKKRISSKVEDARQTRITGMFKAKDAEERGIPRSFTFGTVESDTATSNETTPACPPPPTANPYEDYALWLAQMKPIWREQQQRNRAQRKIFGARGASIRGLSKLVQKQVQSLVAHSWNIIEVLPTEVPGEFKAWVYAGAKLFSVTVEVPRVVYINSLVELDEATITHPEISWIQKSMRLPRSHQSHFVYELTMPEQVFRDLQGDERSIFNRSSITGIYETKIPLLTRAIISMGASTKVDLRRVRVLRSDRFHCSELVSSHELYLPEVSLDGLYLYHATSGNIHVYTVIWTRPQRAMVHVVAPADIGALPNMSRLYSEKYGSITNSLAVQSFIKYVPEAEFTTSYHRTESAALKAIDRQIASYSFDIASLRLAVIQSPYSTTKVKSKIKSLENWPCLTMPARVDDTTFSGLDWQKTIAERMVLHFLGLGDWLHERVALARYSNIPMCNMDADAVISVSDILFARKLRAHNQILWWSPGSSPDLGREDGLTLDFTSYGEDMFKSPIPDINTPGFYRKICIDVDMHRLAINSILESSLANDVEGSQADAGYGSRLGETSNGTTNGQEHMPNALVPNNVSPSIVQQLRQLSRSWLKAAKDGDLFAELLLRHTYRWVTSPSSGMYEPAIAHAVNSAMVKVFSQLLAELKRQGATIITATSDRLVIASSKTIMGSAKTFIDYLTRTLPEKKVLFSHITLQPVTFYESLIWIDRWNYAGIRCKNPEAVVTHEFDYDRDLVMHWGIADDLPPALKSQFSTTISEYLLQAHEMGAARRGHLLNKRNVEANDEIDTFKTWVKSELSRELLDIVQKAEASWRHERDNPQWRFPRMLGTTERTQVDKRPALEFIKRIYEVLALDQTVSTTVRIMRRNLLSLLNISEFAEVSNYHSVWDVSVVIHHWVCDYCQHCRDLDFCRDTELRFDVDTGSSVRALWRCQECGHQYDQHKIEEILIDMLVRLITAYQQQDLTCDRCRLVRADNLPIRCHCSGDYKATMPAKYLRKWIAILTDIAASFKLKRLEASIEWYKDQL